MASAQNSNSDGMENMHTILESLTLVTFSTKRFILLNANQTKVGTKKMVRSKQHSTKTGSNLEVIMGGLINMMSLRL